MNVSSVGGAASLPVPLTPPAHLPGTGAGRVAGGTRATASQTGTATGDAAAAGGSGSTGTGQTAPSGELRLPGQKPARGETSTMAEHHKEKPKPAPLPPLPGLTVAEIRAMLGVVSPKSELTATPGTSSTATAVQAAASRYV